MRNRSMLRRLVYKWLPVVTAWPLLAGAQEEMMFNSYQLLTNREMVLQLTVPKGRSSRIDVSADVQKWSPLVALPLSSGSLVHTDSATPFLSGRFYRAVQLADTNGLTGDYLATSDGDVIIHPIDHATFVMSWQGKLISVDPVPVSGASPYQSLPKADLILVTHEHGDHFDATTINVVKRTNTVILTTPKVYQSMAASLRNQTTVLTNGAAAEVLGMTVAAVPAYNLASQNHPKGVGNGYLVTIGAKTVYISGDTDDTPELRALQGIDVAFVCMDGQYNMNIDRAANAVRQFRPSVVYAYHYNAANPTRFKQLVGTDLPIEVRLRKWE